MLKVQITSTPLTTQLDTSPKPNVLDYSIINIGLQPELGSIRCYSGSGPTLQIKRFSSPILARWKASSLTVSQLP
ncbi:hypothetical protein L1887_01449 [Cichorium endivia]|nr:hypothetical protein L1887_01449 [Cichorium endivia]